MNSPIGIHIAATFTRPGADKVFRGSLVDTVLFDSDDAAYLAWLKDHPEGFVLNARRGEVNAAILHQARCSHIRDLRHSEHAGGFTERGWIKLCGVAIQPLLKQLRARSHAGMVKVQRCRSCSVLDHELLIENDAAELHGRYSGALSVEVRLNGYERDPLLRGHCLAHHGCRCVVCHMQFDMRYGAIGEGFMDVHLVRDLDDITEQRPVDPAQDLIPVCPNCHSMLHRGVQVPRTVAELRWLMSRAVLRRTDEILGPIG